MYLLKMVFWNKKNILNYFLFFLVVFFVSCNRKLVQTRQNPSLRESISTLPLQLYHYTLEQNGQKNIYLPLPSLGHYFSTPKNYRVLHSFPKDKIIQEDFYYRNYTPQEALPKASVLVLSDLYQADFDAGIEHLDIYDGAGDLPKIRYAEKKNDKNNRSYTVGQGTLRSTFLQAVSGFYVEDKKPYTFIFIDSFDELGFHGIDALGNEEDAVLLALKDKKTGKNMYQSALIQNERLVLDFFLDDYKVEQIFGPKNSFLVAGIKWLASEKITFEKAHLEIKKEVALETEPKAGLITIDLSDTYKKINPNQDSVFVYYQKITPFFEALGVLKLPFEKILSIDKKPIELECNTRIVFIQPKDKDHFFIPQNPQINCPTNRYEALLNNAVVFQTLKTNATRRVPIEIRSVFQNNQLTRTLETSASSSKDVLGAAIERLYISINAKVAIGHTPPIDERLWFNQEAANGKHHTIDANTKVFVRSFDKKTINVYHINYAFLMGIYPLNIQLFQKGKIFEGFSNTQSNKIIFQEKFYTPYVNTDQVKGKIIYSEDEKTLDLIYQNGTKKTFSLVDGSVSDVSFLEYPLQPDNKVEKIQLAGKIYDIDYQFLETKSFLQEVTVLQGANSYSNFNPINNTCTLSSKVDDFSTYTCPAITFKNLKFGANIQLKSVKVDQGGLLQSPSLLGYLTLEQQPTSTQLVVMAQEDSYLKIYAEDQRNLYIYPLQFIFDGTSVGLLPTLQEVKFSQDGQNRSLKRLSNGVFVSTQNLTETQYHVYDNKGAALEQLVFKNSDGTPADPKIRFLFSNGTFSNIMLSSQVKVMNQYLFNNLYPYTIIEVQQVDDSAPPKVLNVTGISVSPIFDPACYLTHLRYTFKNTQIKYDEEISERFIKIKVDEPVDYFYKKGDLVFTSADLNVEYQVNDLTHVNSYIGSLEINRKGCIAKYTMNVFGTKFSVTAYQQGRTFHGFVDPDKKTVSFHEPFTTVLTNKESIKADLAFTNSGQGVVFDRVDEKDFKKENKLSNPFSFKNYDLYVKTDEGLSFLRGLTVDINGTSEYFKFIYYFANNIPKISKVFVEQAGNIYGSKNIPNTPCSLTSAAGTIPAISQCDPIVFEDLSLNSSAQPLLLSSISFEYKSSLKQPALEQALSLTQLPSLAQLSTQTQVSSHLQVFSEDKTKIYIYPLTFNFKVDPVPVDYQLQSFTFKQQTQVSPPVTGEIDGVFRSTVIEENNAILENLLWKTDIPSEIYLIHKDLKKNTLTKTGPLDLKNLPANTLIYEVGQKVLTGIEANNKTFAIQLEIKSGKDCSLKGLDLYFSPSSGVGTDFVISPAMNALENVLAGQTIAIRINKAQYIYQKGHLLSRSTSAGKTFELQDQTTRTSGMLEVNATGCTQKFPIWVYGSDFSLTLKQNGKDFISVLNEKTLSFLSSFNKVTNTANQIKGDFVYKGTFTQIGVHYSNQAVGIFTTLNLSNGQLNDLLFADNQKTLQIIRIGNVDYAVDIRFLENLPEIKNVVIAQGENAKVATAIPDNNTCTVQANPTEFLCGKIVFSGFEYNKPLVLSAVGTEKNTKILSVLGSNLNLASPAKENSTVLTAPASHLRVQSEDAQTTYIYPLEFIFSTQVISKVNQLEIQQDGKTQSFSVGVLGNFEFDLTQNSDAVLTAVHLEPAGALPMVLVYRKTDGSFEESASFNSNNIPNNLLIFEVSSGKKLQGIKLTTTGAVLGAQLGLLSNDTSLKGINLKAGISNAITTSFALQNNKIYFVNLPSQQNQYLLSASDLGVKTIKLWKQTQEILPVGGNYTLDYGQNYELEIIAEDKIKKQRYPILLYPQIDYQFNPKEMINGSARLSLAELGNADLLKIKNIVPKGLSENVNLKIAFNNLSGQLISDTTLVFNNAADISLNLKQIAKQSFWKNGNIGNTTTYIISLEADKVAGVDRVFAQSFNRAQQVLKVQFDIPHLRSISDYQNAKEFSEISTLYLYSMDFKNQTLDPLPVDAKLSFTENALVLKNAIINCKNNDHCGIFAKIKGSISHLTLDNIKVQNGKDYVGALAGVWDAQAQQVVVAEDIVVKNSQIVASGNQIGGLVGEIVNLDANTVFKEILNINTSVTGANAVGGLVGKISGGTFVQSGVLATTVKTTTSKGGLLIGEVDARSVVFKLQDIQTIGTLQGSANYQGGVLGYIDNGGSANRSIFNRVIALPEFTAGTSAGKVGIFAGYIQGPANSNPAVLNSVVSNGTGKNQYQNMRVYGAPNVSNVSFSGQKAVVSGKALSTRQDASENIEGVAVKQTYYDRRICPYTSPSKICTISELNSDLFFDNSTQSGLNLASDRKNAPMYWSSQAVTYYEDITTSATKTSTFFPVADERPAYLRMQDNYLATQTTLNTTHIYNPAAKSGATLTYNYFPLSKFGTSPISFALESTVYTYYGQYEPIIKNYSYLLHEYEGVGGYIYMPDWATVVMGGGSYPVKYYRDKTNDMFVPLRNSGDIIGYKDGWRSNFPASHTDKKTILLEAFGKRGYDLEIIINQ